MGGLNRGAFIGFGFLQSASSGAATGAAAAVLPIGRACVASPYQVCRLAGGRRFFASTNV